MRGWCAVCLAAWAALPACGGQVHAVPDAGPDAGPAPVDAAVVLAPCHAGDPPATLVTGLSAFMFNGMATDGTRLYVGQCTAPLLWSMDVRGGPATALYGSNVTNETVSAFPLALLPAAGGLFFDALVDPGDPLSWVRGTGGPVKTVSPAYVGMFDGSGTRGFSWVTSADGGTLSTVSLADGSRTPFATTTTKDDVADVLATTRFIHIILVDPTPPQARFTDRRIDLTNGTVHDEVVLHAGNGGIVAGPNVICELASDAQGLSCLADDQAQDTYIPVAASSAAPFVRYIDAEWVYAEVYPGPSQLSRFSLTDGHEEVLFTGAHPGAVTSFGDCVYAAMVTYSGPPKVEPSTAIWRFSPPRY